MEMDFTEIYCHVDDFFKELDHKTGLITNNRSKTGYQSRLNRSEIITIIKDTGNHPMTILKTII